MKKINKFKLSKAIILDKQEKNISLKILKNREEDYNRHMALISYMPQAISYAIVNSVLKQNNHEDIITLTGGGFKSMSSLAKNSSNIWKDIFKDNKTNLLESINIFNKELHLCQKIIENEEWNDLHKWISKANSLHDMEL